jgi:hypothetical protein
MKGEANSYRSLLKGYMFEVVIMKLLEHNGYKRIECFDGITIRCQRSRFIEFRGRGTWHQIDCPCDYRRLIPFINPLRILGEVKFLSCKVGKDYIREYIGTIKDIQENCFVIDGQDKPMQRYTEIGIYFAAEGFDEEADKLAFAHNIKTISYKDNSIIERIKFHISELEANYLLVKKCLENNASNDFLDFFYQILSGEERLIRAFLEEYDIADECKHLLSALSEALYEVKSSFVASTSGGAFIHFLGKDGFPDELFEKTDEQLCRVHYNIENNMKIYNISFCEDDQNRKFYFSPPLALNDEAFRCEKKMANLKEGLLKTINATVTIGGVSRNLVFKLDSDWLDSIR